MRLVLIYGVCVVILVVSLEEGQGLLVMPPVPNLFRSMSLFFNVFVHFGKWDTQSLLRVGFHLSVRALEQNIPSPDDISFLFKLGS